MRSSGQQFPRPIYNHKYKKKERKKERKKFRHHFQDFEGKRWDIFGLKEAAVLDSHIIMCTEKDWSFERKQLLTPTWFERRGCSPHHQNRRTRFKLFCFVSRTLFECGEVCQWDNLLVRLGQTTRNICVPLNWCNSSNFLLLGVNFVVCSDLWSREILFLIFPLKL